ncbi:helix-turn-helix transcriptional regulator [Tichowtungia aerotolerans]|uniref:DNA-binding protein n=1 Tax=Tichowtungia aerotolerans TaxID=2697043 RepID=A0A6P1M8N5_9BACT|nr:helix-turn-helix domain-containing protein [Tichowtungia aerotolerans]QHI68478.1 hypothetical protein GT409_03085 [Tichowtungia aerotolerans]
MTVTDEQIIQAVFAATDEAKERALQILRGEELPADSNEPLFLTMGEACELIPCSRATLWRIIKAGRLTKIEIYPNAFRLRRTDVLDLARGKAVSRG